MIDSTLILYLKLQEGFAYVLLKKQLKTKLKSYLKVFQARIFSEKIDITCTTVIPKVMTRNKKKERKKKKKGQKSRNFI